MLFLAYFASAAIALLGYWPSSAIIVLTLNHSALADDVTYPNDVDSAPIEDEYTEDIDIEQMYRDMPVPHFSLVHSAAHASKG